MWFLFHLIFSTLATSIALHRYFTHRSFQTGFIVEHIMALLATLCLQGSIQYWASVHRELHRNSDTHGDPHSTERGFFWSHIGWMFYSNPNGYSYMRSLRNIPDLRAKQHLRPYEKHYLTINIAFLILLFAICWGAGRPETFLFIGPLRIVTVWHSTWLLNSYCHGILPFRKHNPSARSTHQLIDSHFMSLLIGGDGYHRSHHDRPHIVKPYRGSFHLDLGYWFLAGCKKLGLVEFKRSS
ncbi:MAG: acyl-CoA desaturase [Bdellovibrionales bacterium]|jgi:stearoyl-CoA desaturase (delta-9 desaturase)|nr:acyl-CoA desaturase [Bdellovibrionales bacterium]